MYNNSRKEVPDSVAPLVKVTQPGTAQQGQSTAAQAFRNTLPIAKEMEQPQAKVDKNKEPVPLWDTGQMGHKPFPEELYEGLPKVLSDACNVLIDSADKQVFLIGALGVISGILPNVTGHYDGRYLGPNLYVYVLGGYGVGKGGLGYARQLGQAIHAAKRSQSEEEQERYEREKQQYEKDKKAYARSKSSDAEPPKPPTPAPNFLLYVPANTSKTMLIQLLNQNANRLLMFETEGDTLADALKQDYAGYSDVLRQSFHHEQISYARRGNGGEYGEIEKPFLSVVLSSTFDQLQTLIKDCENGLFSRFLFYELAGTSEFKDVFDKRKRDYKEQFDNAGAKLRSIYDDLSHSSRQERPFDFNLSEAQQQRFMSHFKDWKNAIHNDVGAVLHGTVNRTAVICWRIAMVLTVLRAFENDQSPTSLPDCSDQDFKSAMQIVESLKSYALSTWSRLPKSPNLEEDEQDDAKKASQRQQCRELHEKGLSVRAIAIQVFGSDAKKSTVFRWTR
jgi:hypothetical protein